MNNAIMSLYYFCFLMIVTASGAAFVWAAPPEMPEPDPPVMTLHAPAFTRPVMKAGKAVPTAEWAYHKTPDNRHPDHNEQQMLWLMNRARSNPAQEGLWLADTGDVDVIGAVSYFSVDLDVLRAEFAAIDIKPPAAFDIRLYTAAKAHSDDLIVRDAQDHTGQFERVAAAEFSYTMLRGNVFSYTKSAVHGHAGFNIDWGGDDGTGMQMGRGHRLAIMSMDGDYTNVGLAMVSETDSGTEVGPLVTTGNYAHANEARPDHYNRFLVGTVWEDQNDNAMYDPGEGLEAITVTPDQGNYYAVTSDSGGYSIPVDSGDYQVTFSGIGLSETMTRSVTVGATSVLCDLLYTGIPGDDPADDPDEDGESDPVLPDSGSGDDGGGGCFIDSLNLTF